MNGIFDSIGAFFVAACPVWNFLINALAYGATFIYGATGEIITEKSGHLNLGIPGIMCMGGAGGCLALNIMCKSMEITKANAELTTMQTVELLVVPILCAFLLAALCGLIYSFLTITLRANQNVTGLALTTFGSGLMMVLFQGFEAKFYLNRAKALFRYPYADYKTFSALKKTLQKIKLDNLVYLGPMFFLAIVIALVAWFVLYKTKKGLNLRAVGENPGTADAAGINVTRYKYIATIIGSGIAGLGGFYYIVDYMQSPDAYKSIEALGWLSVALVIFSLWRPQLTIIGATLFGLLSICPYSLPQLLKDTANISLPMAITPLLNMLPYIVTVLVLIISSIRNKRENQPPASLGLSYFREER